jgi:ribosomal subunit interface protein
MQINIKSTNLDLTPAIQEYIEIKIGSLEHFLRRFVGVRPCVGLKRFELKNEIKIFVELARATKHHKSGNVFYAEATLALGKKVLRAEHSDWNIRVAIDKIKDKLQQEIKKYKEIRSNH